MPCYPRVGLAALFGVTVGVLPGAAWAQPPRLEPTDVDKPWGSTGSNQPDPREAPPAGDDPATTNSAASSQPDAETEAGEGAEAAPSAVTETTAPSMAPAETPVEPNDAIEAEPPAQDLSGSARAQTPTPEKDAIGDPKHPFKLEGQLGKKEREGSMTVYGILVVNAAYNTGTPFPTQEAPIGAAKNSRNGDGLPSDGSFVITPRQSRLGFDGKLQITDAVDASAKLEADFFGLQENVGPGGVPQTGIRLRQAYMDVGGKKWRFLAGQTWSVVTPRLPTSIGHLAIALHTFSGAVWNRLPQLAGVYRQPVASGSKLGDAAVVVQVSAARSVSHDGFGGSECPPEIGNPDSLTRPNPSPGPTCRVTRFDDPDQGTLAGFPVGQARVSFESKQLTVGVGGHAGAEKWWATELDGGGAAVTDPQLVPTWMVTADVRVSPKWFWINAQGYYGANINGMFSRQGVRANAWQVAAGDPRAGTPRSFTALPGFGGWLEIGAPLGTDKVKLVASGGADIGDRNGDLLGEDAQVGEPPPGVPDGAVWANFGVFGAVIYAPHPNFDMSLEYQRATSVYKRWIGDRAEIRNDWGFNDQIGTNFRLKF